MSTTSVSRVFRLNDRPVDEVADRHLERRIASRLFSTVAPRMTIGRFEVLGTLGKGGGGIVYEARDPKLHRRVAIKVYASHPCAARASTLRFEGSELHTEARTLAQLSHPNIVKVFEVDEDGGDVFIVMEKVEGANLLQWLLGAGQHSPLATKLRLLSGAAKGLRAAHAHGVVHGDIKPGNILVDGKLNAMLADFGLASPLDDDTGSGARRQTLAGTPPYMAPEQHYRAPPSVRTDIYSFCVTVLEVLTAQRVFRGTSLEEIIEAKTRGVEQFMGMVPPHLRAALRAGTQHDPRRRLDTMEPLVEALSRPATGRRKGLWAILAAIGLSSATALASVGDHDEPCQPSPHRLEEVWSGEHRGGIEEAFVRTGLELAPEAARRTIVALDGYGAQWQQGAREHCDAMDMMSTELSLRQAACLHRSLAAMTSLVQLLQTADAALVTSAPMAVASLPGIDGCEADVLDPQARTASEAEILTELARTEITREAGRFREADAMLGGLVERSEQSSPGIRARVLDVGGMTARDLGDTERAHAMLEQAYEFAVQADDDEIVVRTAANLSRVVGFYNGRQDTGRTWDQVAMARAQRLPADSEARLDAMRNHISRLFFETRYAEAVPLLREYGERVRAAGIRPFERVGVPNDLAVACIQLGYYAKAKVQLERALAAGKELLGADHPRLNEVYFNLAFVSRFEGESTKARRYLERAYSISRAARGPDHEAVAMPALMLAELDLEAGHIERARERVDMSHQILTKLHPEGTRDFSASYRMQGELARLEGDHQRSIRLQRRALEVVYRYTSRDYPGSAKYLLTLGRALHDGGKLEEAHEVLADAEAMMREHRAETVMRWQATLHRAAVLWDEGQIEHARRVARPALRELSQRGTEAALASVEWWNERDDGPSVASNGLEPPVDGRDILRVSIHAP
ncbi:MAG: serine/threonine-protein kinase [Myxococcota bacterium]